MVQLVPSLALGPEIKTRELDQLLSRLRRTVLHPDPQQERRLSADDFERARVSSNLEYARDLLTILEQDATGIQAPGRRQNAQAELLRKKELLDQLLGRMRDLAHMEVVEDDSEGEEDILAGIIHTPTGSIDSISLEGGQATAPDSPTETRAAHAEPTSSHQEHASPLTPSIPTEAMQTLRARGRHGAPPATEPTSYTAARATLFAARRGGRSSPGAAGTTTMTTTATAEAIMDHHRSEQEALSASILQMASRLKASTQYFSKTLESDKAVMDRAGDSVDATGKRMDSAGRRMNLLKKLTEGKGWWGRMILFAEVYGLMVALILVVFVLPKVRF